MKPKILIVDDEPLNLATLEAFLATDGYELLFAQNGQEALKKAEGERPDLILLDVMMPELDGFEVTRRIRVDPDIGRIPIILITALDDERSRLEGLRTGADDFLTKPCRREEIRARVRTVVSLNRFRSIAEQRSRFEQLFELAAGGIILVDAHGKVVAANARAELHHVGEPYFAPFGAASSTTLRATVTDAWHTRSRRACEVRLGTGETERILHAHAVVVPEEGRPLMMLSFHDVTAQARAREAVERMNAELEEIVRARTRQLEESNGLLMSYASFVSHDLRSPLTVMKGYLSLIQEGVVPLADAGPLVGHAFNATVIMQEMIQNILQLAQDEHAGAHGETSEDVDPTPVVRKLATRMREIFPTPVPRFEIANLPRVGVSAVLIERVFYNLLANALKFSAQREQPRVEVGSVDSPEGPVIFVRDNGVGFDARDADKLFREFSRLSSGAGTDGLGLGLSLVSRLLRAHGGRIWAESAVGEGATFFLLFPSPAKDRVAGTDEAAG
jgi:signal transduction histidine kinase